LGLEAYFLDRKAQLDKVIYSLIRTQDMELPRNSISGFNTGAVLAELAREYSQGPEAETGGLIGPVELSNPHPAIAQMLSIKT